MKAAQTLKNMNQQNNNGYGYAQPQQAQVQRAQGHGANKIVEYKCGNETVKLSQNIVRNFLVSGNGNVTDQELVLFINLCRFQHLNPYLKEAHLIKYGNNPATMVVGKDAFMKRAKRNKDYRGFEAGVIVMANETGVINNRSGALVLPGETLVGGWAKVYVHGYDVPVENVVGFDEYAGRKKDGSLNNQWATKPATMIRKVALVQSLREAFPEDFAGLYDQSEMGLDSIDETPVPQDVVDKYVTVEHAPAEDVEEVEVVEDAEIEEINEQMALEMIEHESAGDRA